LTTPIGPPRLETISGEPEPPQDASFDQRALHSKLWKIQPSVSRRGDWLRASHVIRKGSFDTVRATSRRAEPFFHCTVVEIATHPIVRVMEVDQEKPDPLSPHAGVCFVCDQHRIAKKLRPAPRLRREGGSKHGSFLV
jgi:hypothetical protein